jgi:hypothetical protein
VCWIKVESETAAAAALPLIHSLVLSRSSPRIGDTRYLGAEGAKKGPPVRRAFVFRRVGLDRFGESDFLQFDGARVVALVLVEAVAFAEGLVEFVDEEVDRLVAVF